MPPRQPLRLNKPKAPRNKVGKDVLASLAEEILNAAPAPAPKAEATPPKRTGAAFSPYPDLSMAIAMLAKRQQALATDGERGQLVGRWLATLQTLQTEMQKLHKLETLAGRLAGKS